MFFFWDFLLTLLTFGKWKRVKEVYETSVKLFDKFGNAESISEKLSNIDSFFQEKALLEEKLNSLKRELDIWSKFESVSKVDWELSNIEKIKEELKKIKEQFDRSKEELDGWARFGSLSKVEQQFELLENIKEELGTLKNSITLKDYELSNLKKELECWSKFESIPKVEWQLDELKKVKEEAELKEKDLNNLKELVASVGGKEAFEKIHSLVQEHNGLDYLVLKLKNYSDMCREVSEIAPEKTLRNLINDWKERLMLKGLSKKSTDIGNSMGEVVERMLKDSFSNVPNFSWEKEKSIPETGKRVDFFFEFRHRKGLFGKVVLENKNGSQWSPKAWKEQITEYVNSTDSFCGILLIPQRQEGLEEVEKGVTVENRNFPIFSFDNVEDLKKFLTLILWLSLSYNPPREITDDIGLTLSTDDMHESITRTCGTICKNYSDFLEGFNDLENKISVIFKKSKSFQNYILKLKEKISRNKIVVQDELELMQQYSRPKKLSIPETIPELLTEVEDDEE